MPAGGGGADSTPVCELQAQSIGMMLTGASMSLFTLLIRTDEGLRSEERDRELESFYGFIHEHAEEYAVHHGTPSRLRSDR